MQAAALFLIFFGPWTAQLLVLFRQIKMLRKTKRKSGGYDAIFFWFIEALVGVMIWVLLMFLLERSHIPLEGGDLTYIAVPIYAIPSGALFCSLVLWFMSMKLNKDS